MIMVGDHLLERRPQPLALLPHVGEEFLIGDNVEHRLPRGHRHRVAAKGRTVGSDHHPGRRFLAREAGAHREAAADPLGGGHDVGDDAVMLVGVELTGAGDAALNLVEHQHQIMLVAGGAKAGEEFVRAGADAALALNRLDQETGRVLVDRGQRRAEVVELDHLEPRKQRREAVDHLGLIGRADRRHRPAVERIRETDQIVLVRIALGVMIFARGLDRAFDRLDARIGEEHRVGEGQVGEPLGERFPLRRAVQVGDVHQRRRLFLDRLGQMRVAMAENVDRNPRGEIEIALALFAIEIDPFATDRADRRTRIDGHERRSGQGRLPLTAMMRLRRL